MQISNGKAEIVVQDAATYQKTLDDLDELESIAGCMVFRDVA
jgi:hypothetical protein